MKILIFGDSHSSYFNLTEELKLVNNSFAGVEVHVVKLPGASINGFGKRESTLNSRAIFSEELLRFKPDYICFALGQVDIELGYYYRTIVRSESLPFAHFVDELCNNYINTINELSDELEINFEKIIIKGINISVLTKSRDKAIRYTSRIISENIKDNSEVKIYNQKIRDNFPSNLERYSVHKYFNFKLQELNASKYKYFDINDLIEDKNSKGEVDIRFIPSGFDHHLSDSLFIRNLHLQRLINTILCI